MPVRRIPLRHYRLLSRAPYLEILDDAVSVRLPSFFGGNARWTIQLSDVVVVQDGRLAQVDQDRATGRVFATPIVIPYLATTTPNVPPNLQLLFRSPQRVPPVRWAARFTSASLSHRRSRTPDGVRLDGVALRAVDQLAAAETLVRAGVEVVPSAGWWLAEHRETTTAPERVKAVRTATKRQRVVAWMGAVAIPLLVLARWGLDRSRGRLWPYVVLALCVFLIFGAPAWARFRSRRLAIREAASAKGVAHDDAP